jgi:hypothetical protein
MHNIMFLFFYKIAQFMNKPLSLQIAQKVVKTLGEY